jgi:hypothetical protein
MHQNMHQRFPSSSNSQQISDKSFILLVPGGGADSGTALIINKLLKSIDAHTLSKRTIRGS